MSTRKDSIHNMNRLNRRRFLKQSAAAGSALAFLPDREGIAAGENNSSQPSPSLSTQTLQSERLLDLSPAKWIWYPSERCLQNTFVLFRKEIDLAETPKSAAGWVLADSRYELLVNGKRIHFGPAPCDPRWLEADPVDIASALRPGKNVVAAKVLFYGQGDGTSPLGKPGFIFLLNVENSSGKTVISSDSSWNACLPRSWQPGHYKRWYLRSLQEEFDARLYPEGWDRPDYVLNEDWLPAMELPCPSDKPTICASYSEYMLEIQGKSETCNLRSRDIPLMDESEVPIEKLSESCWIEWKRPPVEYFECLPPNSFAVDRTPCAREIESGVWSVTLDGKRAAALTFELKDQVVGWPHFTIDAPEGTVIEMMVHEAHKLGGPALLNSHYYSWSRFICKQGVNTFRTFDFESCRWIQLHVHGAQGTITVRDIGMLRRIYPWPNPPQVRCSDPALQRLIDATVNTLHNCAQETLVDGMARERQQYSGDCGHQLHAIYMTFGETKQPARYIKTFSQGITKDGFFLDCWPAYDRLARLMERQLDLTGWGPILDHGVGLNFDCYHHYLYTGDLKALEEPYPRLLRFADYLQSIRDENGLLPVENIGIPSVWIDHDAYQKQKHKQCVFNLYAAAMFEHALAPICRAFGDEPLSRRFAQLGQNLLASTVKRYWSSERGLFVANLPWLSEEGGIRLCDRSLATSILFDQCPAGNIQNAARILADCPPEMGFAYPANAGWRLWALGKTGRVDVILNDLRIRWATMDSVILNNTLQEVWKATFDGGTQWSHCPVAPLYALFMCVAGIKPLEPGFTSCEIRPQLADLDELNFTAYTVQGSILFQSHGRLGSRELTIALPEKMKGEIVLPEKETIDLEAIGGRAPAGCKRYRLRAEQQVLHLKTV